MSSNPDNQFQVTSIDWSCNGAVLAVAYGKTDHVSWCEHNSILNVWSIFRRDFDAEKPNATVEISNNCLSTLQFHPENPMIIAGGSINGEIYIWSLHEGDGKESQLVAKSEADEYFHREPIRKIAWHLQEQEGSLQKEETLFTCSADGKVLMWKNPLRKDGLRFPIKGHLLRKEKQILGGTSFSMFPKLHDLDVNTFIVGC